MSRLISEALEFTRINTQCAQRGTMTKGHWWCQLLYLYRHPNISLMCNPCHLCLLASPFHLMCSFDTNDKRSHGSMSSHHTPFLLFSFKNDTRNHVEQPKGTSSREVEICALESNSFALLVCFQSSASTCRVWLASTFVCPLEEAGLSTSFSCHVDPVSDHFFCWSLSQNVWLSTSRLRPLLSLAI